MWNNFLVYLSEIVGHWLPLVFGPLITLALVFAEKKLKWEIKWKHYVIVFLIGIPFAMFFAWQDEYTSAEWRGQEVIRLNTQVQDRETQVARMQNQLENKQRPIIVQAAPDPAVEELLVRQEKELRAFKSELPSPRKRTLQLSNDILNFLADRMKEEPNMSPRMGLTKEQYLNAMNAMDQEYIGWMNQTASEYQVRFGVRVQTAIDDMQSAGIKTGAIQGCVFSNGNTFGIQECGARIGSLAEKLSH